MPYTKGGKWEHATILDAEMLAVNVNPCQSCTHALCILARWILKHKGYRFEGNPTAPGEWRWRLD